MTAEFPIRRQAALTSAYSSSIRLYWASLQRQRQRQRQDMNDPAVFSSTLAVERQLAALAVHIFPVESAVTPGAIAQFLEAIAVELGWISAAASDFQQAARTLAKLPSDAFSSRGPSLLRKRDQLLISARSSRQSKQVTKPVLRAVVLHHEDAGVSRIMSGPQTGNSQIEKDLAVIFDILADAQDIRIRAQSADTFVSLETLKASLLLVVLRLPLELKEFSKYPILGPDEHSFLVLVRSLINQDLQIINRLSARFQQALKRTRF